MSDKLTREEFVNGGYLQEVNRCFFHPLGLSISLTNDGADSDVSYSVEILDSRDDPDGCFFRRGEIDAKKIRKVAEERYSKATRRVHAAHAIKQLPSVQVNKT